MKGHTKLAASMRDAPLKKVERRHITRSLSDSYGKGIVPSQAEAANLRLYSNPKDVTNAESIKTFMFAFIPGQSLVDMLESHNAMEPETGERCVALELQSRGRRTNISDQRPCAFVRVASWCGAR